jgi:hypothetical protein
VWLRDGREQFFRTSDALMAAQVIGRAPLTLDVPEALFKDPYLRPQGEGHTTTMCSRTARSSSSKAKVRG